MTGAAGFKERGSLSGSIFMSIVGIDDDNSLYATERLCIKNTSFLVTCKLAQSDF